MKLPWLFSLTAGLTLGSATPPPAIPPPALPYRLAGFVDLEPACAERRAEGCILLTDDKGQSAIPAVVVEPTVRPKRRVEARPAAAADTPRPSGGALRVLVSIPQQKIYVFRGEELVATSPVSTGKRGHATPTGTFRILQKRVWHRSSKYSNAPMPYMQRLTSYGIALHAGRLPGYPASHGCIRLPRGFARTLFGMTDHGTRVTITSRRPRSNREAGRIA